MPGMRVWNANGVVVREGTVIDLMAKLDTKDGQRLLGVWSENPGEGTDLDSTAHSLEPLLLRPYDLPQNITPLAMNNRDLGGPTVVNNPGVTDGNGLPNIGGYVAVWGRVKEVGTLALDPGDASGYSNIPYLLVSDGANVSSGALDELSGLPKTGVMIFGTSGASVGDYATVTGVSSVWRPAGQPGGALNGFRSVWTSGSAFVNDPGTTTASHVTSYGTISGQLKLYDLSTTAPDVYIYCTGGRMCVVQAASIQRHADGSGTATYSLTVPSVVEVTVTGAFGTTTYTESPEYVVSARADGYKTRSYTKIQPGATRNIYLVRLRKIYVRTDTDRVTACSGSASITATVRGPDHELVTDPITITFGTDKGAFPGPNPHRYSMSTTTGMATAVLSVASTEWGAATVEATDDSAPLAGDPEGDDPYAFDWVQVHDAWAQPVTIYLDTPAMSLTLSPDPIVGTVCENEKPLSAAFEVCGTGVEGQTVRFHTSVGTFKNSGATQEDATTNPQGVASVTLVRPEHCRASQGTVWAEAVNYYGMDFRSSDVPASWQSWILKLSVTPDWIVVNGTATIEVKLTLDDGTTPVPSQLVTLRIGLPSGEVTVNVTTNDQGEASHSVTVDECPFTVDVTGTTTTCDGDCVFTDSTSFDVLCSEEDAIEVLFAVDMTGSMNGGGPAMAPLEQLINDLVAAGEHLKLGGLKFDNYVYDVSAMTSDRNAFLAWLRQPYPPERDGGLDINENQLEALKTCSEMAPGGFVALATDSGFHYWGDNTDPHSKDHQDPNNPDHDCIYTHLTAQQVHDILVAAACKVYIDAGNTDQYDPQASEHYTMPNPILHVNGAMEDTSYGTYTFPKLKNAVLAP